MLPSAVVRRDQSVTVAAADGTAHGPADGDATTDTNLFTIGDAFAFRICGTDDRTAAELVADTNAGFVTAESRTRRRRIVRIDGDGRFRCVDLASLPELIVPR